LVDGTLVYFKMKYAVLVALCQLEYWYWVCKGCEVAALYATRSIASWKPKRSSYIDCSL